MRFRGNVRGIFLNDGSRIKVRGRVVEREGGRAEIDFFSGCSSAYEELMELFNRKTSSE